MTGTDGASVLVASLVESNSRSADEVRDVTAELIRAGSLAVGTRLPPIRELSRRSGLSTRAIVSAWSALRRWGLIETNRRGGTIVIDPRSQTPSWAERDLLTGSPDYDLQPDLAAALTAGLHSEHLNHPGREYITDRLRGAVTEAWPFQAEAYMAASGGSEGLLLAVEAAAPAGTLIAVEEPVMPGFLDTLADAGYQVIGIAADEHGARADSLAEVLDAAPSVLVLQPEGGYSCAGSLSDRRAAELAAVLATTQRQPWIVEDDAVGPLADAQAPSLGQWYPHQTVRVRSYCKAFGMDIKTCVIGGSDTLIDRAIRLRVHGIAANSRILQNALAHLIIDTDAAAMVDVARSRYRRRRSALLAALIDRGVPARAGPNSLVVWAEVADETGALIDLARNGINVGSGQRSYVKHAEPGLVRIAVPQLLDSPQAIDELADSVAAAAGSVHREFLG
ncbi:aminotransferase class I/II-fold pyridoxal phosphate-dependent enzyme [Gordonia sp. CPCC 206044]|uniref:aminotransferase class I/II-fold pyridoxal phosphate-dependent enzyme n=1 Tax=Gordonia sp. CPCC 206044 TaxID=3140793 RepID=UPI003AF38ECA